MGCGVGGRRMRRPTQQGMMFTRCLFCSVISRFRRTVSSRGRRIACDQAKLLTQTANITLLYAGGITLIRVGEAGLVEQAVVALRARVAQAQGFVREQAF